jgi:hypothetical protein
MDIALQVIGWVVAGLVYGVIGMLAAAALYVVGLLLALMLCSGGRTDPWTENIQR